MHSAVRKNDILASNLYLAGFVLGYLVHIVQVQLPLLKLLYSDKEYSLATVIICGFILILALMLWIGIALRAGKTWAKAAVILIAIWRTFLFVRGMPDGEINFTMLAPNLLTVGLELAAAAIIIKQGMERPAKA